MRTFRLAILGQSPCHLCHAACCKASGPEYAVLLEGHERRKFAAFAQSVSIRDGDRIVGEMVLPYRDGRCIFLDQEDRCRIYDDRPVNCRRFECVDAFHHRGGDVTGHRDFLRRNPRVREMLEKL